MQRVARGARGYTFVEILMVIAIIVIASGAAIPTGLSQVESRRLDAAARYVASLCAVARSQAVRRSAFVGIRFETDSAAGDFAFGMYVDGNRDGVRTRDITAGVDPPIAPREHLRDRFQGIRFGIAAGVAGIDPPEVLSEGDDPIRLGSTDILSFNPNGCVTSGTLYIRSQHGQRAIRLLGATGRTRLLSFWFPERRWIDQ